MQVSTIELHKEHMKFSVAHFTIFSATERENLHGHNYTVSLIMDVEVKELGLSFDYRDYKKIMLDLCKSINSTLLLPRDNPYLKITEEDKIYRINFADEEMLLPKRDVTILPIHNITVEELSRWMVSRLIEHFKDKLAHDLIRTITIKVFSAIGQSGSFSQKLQ